MKRKNNKLKVIIIESDSKMKWIFFTRVFIHSTLVFPLSYFAYYENRYLIIFICLLIWFWSFFYNLVCYYLEKKIYRNIDMIHVYVGGMVYKYNAQSIRMTIEDAHSRYTGEEYYLCLRNVSKIYPKILFGQIILDFDTEHKNIKVKMSEIENELGINGYDLT